jgi:hypothetical protein
VCGRHLGWFRLDGCNVVGVVPHRLFANSQRRSNSNEL